MEFRATIYLDEFDEPRVWAACSAAASQVGVRAVYPSTSPQELLSNPAVPGQLSVVFALADDRALTVLVETEQFPLELVSLLVAALDVSSLVVDRAPDLLGTDRASREEVATFRFGGTAVAVGLVHSPAAWLAAFYQEREIDVSQHAEGPLTLFASASDELFVPWEPPPDQEVEPAWLEQLPWFAPSDDDVRPQAWEWAHLWTVAAPVTSASEAAAALSAVWSPLGVTPAPLGVTSARFVVPFLAHPEHRDRWQEAYPGQRDERLRLAEAAVIAPLGVDAALELALFGASRFVSKERWDVLVRLAPGGLRVFVARPGGDPSAPATTFETRLVARLFSALGAERAQGFDFSITEIPSPGDDDAPVFFGAADAESDTIEGVPYRARPGAITTDS